MTASKIEWTERSDWNPIRGCTRISPGCGGPGDEGGCYAEAMAARFSDDGQWGHGYAERTAKGGRWTGRVAVQWDRLDLPLRWRKASIIFASSTSDFFHEKIPMDEVTQLFGVMIAAHHLRGHIFQVLTKRADRMRAFLNNPDFWELANVEAGMHVMEHVDPLDRRSDDARAKNDADYGPDKPPPGIWLGVSVEDQQRADERVPDLIWTPAAVRFLSCEPLLGPVDLTSIKAPRWPEEPADELDINWRFDALTTGDYYWFDPGQGYYGDSGDGPYRTGRIDWVIAGGESGQKARPMHPDWVRGLRDQCAGATLHGDEAPVPFFFKQWGEWAPDVGAVDGWTIDDDPEVSKYPHRDWEGDHYGEPYGRGWMDDVEPDTVSRIGKKQAGRLLDGIEHSEMPR